MCTRCESSRSHTEVLEIRFSIMSASSRSATSSPSSTLTPSKFQQFPMVSLSIWSQTGFQHPLIFPTINRLADLLFQFFFLLLLFPISCFLIHMSLEAPSLMLKERYFPVEGLPITSIVELVLPERNTPCQLVPHLPVNT